MMTQHPFLNTKVEIPKERELDVQNIQNWLAHQPHLPKIRDDHVLLFLHSCYYSEKRTKDTIEHYFSFRAQSPELFAGWQFSKLHEVWKLHLMAALPKSTPEGYGVLIYRLLDLDPSKFNLQETMRTFFAYNDIRISEDGLFEGYVVIFDMRGYSFRLLTKLTMRINLVRKFMTYIQECHPARLKGIHLLSDSSFIESCLTLVKPFLQAELKQLIHVHSDLHALEPFIPLEVMPSDYGGMGPNSAALHEAHVEMVSKHYVDWLTESEKLVADLKKRN